jgi:predicted O-linked N-acetylglucosamine transferase (SPINDLY family)
MTDYRDVLREALALQQAGRFVDAAARYRAVLEERPEEPNATYLLGVTLHQLGSPDEAIPLLTRAVEQRPDFADAHNNLGEALRAAKRAEDAVARYTRALELSPSHPAYLANLSHGRLAARNAPGALDAARAAIEADPGLAPAYQALGNVLLEMGELDGARDALERALRLAPDFLDAAGNLAILEAKYGDAARACALFEPLAVRRHAHADTFAKALARAGRADAAQAVRLAAVSRAANPGELARESPILFAANYDTWAPDFLWELHRQWGGAMEAFANAPAAAARDRTGGPLRVGFVSNDFKRHSCAHFLLPLFEAFEPARIAAIAYSDVEKSDAVTERLRGATAAWRPIRGLDDAAVAAKIRADGIDILVDLGGHTADHRLGVFARKPAPVQVSWLGYANTTGLSRIDWRFTDAIADPPGAEAHHSERLWRLAGGFLRFALFETPPIPVRTPGTGGFRFGSFNALEKISEPCWAAWCGILRAAPGATLVLKAFALKDKAMRAAWSARAREAGLDGRIRLLDFDDDENVHLARYAEIDLALDTAPYGGTTTSCEALWMGVPLLTLAGARHATRTGASLLARVQDAGVVVDSWDAYRAAAIDLAARGANYARLAERLAERARAGALADGASLAAEMTDAFERMRAGA